VAVSSQAKGIMFHHFHGGKNLPDGQGSLSAEDVYSIVTNIGLQRFLSPSEWIERVKNQSLRDYHLCLTLDDGLMSQYEICLPVLEDLGLKAFWFIYTCPIHGDVPRLDVYKRFRTKYFDSTDHFLEEFLDYVDPRDKTALSTEEFGCYESIYSETFPFYSYSDIVLRFLRDRKLSVSAYEAIVDGMINRAGLTVAEVADQLWMSSTQIAELCFKGHFIGLHSYSHPIPLSGLSREDQNLEYRRNLDDIQMITKEHPISMAHPANSYNIDSLEILDSLGVVCGFRSNLSLSGLIDGYKNLQLPRADASSLRRSITG